MKHVNRKEEKSRGMEPPMKVTAYAWRKCRPEHVVATKVSSDFESLSM